MCVYACEYIYVPSALKVNAPSDIKKAIIKI